MFVVRRSMFDVRLLPRIWHYSWPTIVHSLLQWVVGMADIYMVGRLGSEAISAVGFSQQIMMVIMIGALAVSTGAMTLVAQAWGAKDKQQVSSAARQALLLALAGALVIGVVGNLLSHPMLLWLGARERVLDLATPYLRLMFCGILFMLPNFIIAAIFRGAGDMLTPLKISAGLNVINIAVSYVLIFGVGPFPRLEVTGAGVGTVVARCLGTFWGLMLLTGGRTRVVVHLRDGGLVDFEMMRRILRVGVPSAVQGLFRNGARLLFFWIIATSGVMTAATAALTIGFQLRMLVIMPALAMMAAATALVGQSLGAGEADEAERYGAQTIRLGALIMVAANALIFALARPVMLVFAEDAAVIDIGIEMLRYFAVAQLFSALSIVSAGALTGGGDTKPPMYYTALSQWVILLPLAYALQRFTPLGLTGSWIAWALAPVVQAALTYARFRQGTWKRLKV